MQLKILTGAGMALAMLSVAGCAPMTKVKDVQLDRQAYMNANFSPDKLNKDIVRTVSSADPGPLGFQKMVFHLNWQLNDDDKNKMVAFEQEVSYSNAGGSLVQSRVDDSRNGVTINENYSLSYRGVLSLMSQFMNLNAVAAAPVSELKSLQHFDAATRPKSAGQLDYQYKLGFAAQLMNFREGRNTCQVGPDYAASKLNAQLAGDAHDLDCVAYNGNGVKVHSTRFAYLDKYGVAIVTHTEYAAGISDATVASVEIH